MDLVLCHLTADFDTLGAAVGISRLHPGTRIVLAGGCHPTVRAFLALHRDEYPLIERRSVSEDQIRSITVVDTQWRDRLGSVAFWLDRPNCPVTVYDHHIKETEQNSSQPKSYQASSPQQNQSQPIQADDLHIEAVGAATTLVVEALQAKDVSLTPIDATAMALGIHVDTGSLTFDHSTARDAAALTWLMVQGANPRVIAEYVEPGLSPTLQDLLPTGLQTLQTKDIDGVTLAWAMLDVSAHIPGMSSLASRIMTLTESDVLIFATAYPYGEGLKVNIIGRSRGGGFSTAHLSAIDLGHIFRELGGGGHAKAAAVTLHLPSVQENLNDILHPILRQIESQLPPPPKARTLMSSPVRTIRPDISIAEAHRILLRYGHSGLSVVDDSAQLVGIISRRDLDIALHHNFSHAPVKGFMSTNLKTISPDMSLPEIEALMVTYDIGRLPVLDGEQLVGIVTRTDVLRQIHTAKQFQGGQSSGRGEMNWDGEWADDSTNTSTEHSTENSLEGLAENTPHAPDVSFHAPISLPAPPTISSQRFNQNYPRRYCPLPQTVIQRLRDRLIPSLWGLLQAVAKQAEERGWQLYLVGGAVRDLLLAKAGDPFLIPDIDLVVDGCHHTAEQAAGVELAKAIQSEYPKARLQVHGRFQTAALLWHNDPVLESLWLDIATARTEFYPYPAANPEVEASSIRQDLYRRDFTINALAIRLTSPRLGELLDFFGGTLDLDARQIRVLHTNSFIEDPTRIFRAVRFAVRLGFDIEPQTQRYIEHAIASGIYHRVQSEMEVTPALQTRLRKELQHILEAPYWRTAIQLLNQLNALQCIHESLALSPGLWWQLRLVDRWLKRFDRSHQLSHWLVLLEVLISSLNDPYPQAVAENLQLPADSIRRLAQLSTIQSNLQQALLPIPPIGSPADAIEAGPLPKCQVSLRLKPSTIVSHLKSYDLPTLILLGARSDRPLRRWIWQYLTHWSHVRSPLNGNDLKALGYKPGRQFKVLLESLLAATLDGEIENAADAKTFLSTFANLE